MTCFMFAHLLTSEVTSLVISAPGFGIVLSKGISFCGFLYVIMVCVYVGWVSKQKDAVISAGSKPGETFSTMSLILRKHYYVTFPSAT